MAEKYIDLYETISDDMFIRPDEVSVSRCVLEWLDEHPDQVPKRTMTESEVVEVFEASKSGGGATRTALIRHGIKVVPDPEPTNAEKLERIWADWDPTREGVWEFFDRRGVKAPGGDNGTV